MLDIFDDKEFADCHRRVLEALEGVPFPKAEAALDNAKTSLELRKFDILYKTIFSMELFPLAKDEGEAENDSTG